MNRLLKLVLSVATLIGVSNANTGIAEEKLNFVSGTTEDTPLMLNHSSDLQKELENMINKNNDLAYHYSHRSHYSHQSHQSHYSHYSSYGG